MTSDDDSVVIPRLIRIFKLRGLGYSQSEIATRISVSQQTVSYYLRLMKSKSERIGVDKYFSSLLPYFSESTVNHAEVFEKIKKELHEEREKDRMELNKEMDSIIKFEKKNQKDIKILEDEINRLSELVNNSGVNRRRS